MLSTNFSDSPRTIIKHSNFLPLGCVVCILIVPLHYNKLICLPIFSDELSGAHPNMYIKVAAYIMAYLHYYTDGNWD